LSFFAGTGNADVAVRSLPVPAKFCLIPRLETHPSIVSFCQTVRGKILLLLIFGIELAVATHMFYVPVLIALALMTAFPSQRRLLLTCFTLAFAFAVCWRTRDLSKAIDIVLVCSLAAALFYGAIKFPQSFLGRRPLICLFASFFVAVFCVSFLPAESRVHAALWDFLIVLGLYVCAIAYSLLDRNSKSRDSFALQLGTYRAFWGMTVIPYPKGAAYLRRVEAKTPEALAISQIKGVKLLAWALVLFFLWKSVIRVVHGYFGVPSYPTLFELSAAGSSFPRWLGWVALISAFFEKLLRLSYLGHEYIAICRMAGFLAVRNTFRPLSSRTIAEFWNRYYYYYKEMLVDFFFYPTFMRYFKSRPRLRLFAATFAAACLGNALLHFFTGYMEYAQRFGLWNTLQNFRSYFLYSTPLAIGIGISQIRNAPKRSGWFRGHLVPAICVIGFFCLLYIFDNDVGIYPPVEHFRFLGHLLNLR
jgi:hypothetical protein